MCAQGAPRLNEVYGSSARHVFVTICTWQRHPLLTPLGFGGKTRDQLLQCATVLGVDVCAYTVMPDHAHVLLRAKSDAVSRFVWRWKQATGYRWRQEGNRHPSWQRGFYDRVLRLDEDPKSLAAYVVMNPVRAGLVSRPDDYPLSGAPAYTNLL